MAKATAAEVVKSLQQQTPYTFIYDPEYLQQCTLSDLKFQGAALGDVLAYIDNNAPLDIELTKNNTIAIRKGNADKPAAKTNGHVAGKVVDSKNEPLPGVTITTQSGQGTVTNVDGTYNITLPPGVYNLTFSYVSFDTRKVTEVTVDEKGVTPLDIVMKSSSSQLKAVTVTANYRKTSIEGLYAMQKNNPAISDGISAEQIARTPDKNIGEVLKRVTGLATMDNKYVVVRGLSERYNQAVLNGQVMPSTELNRKNFSFDIIPSNIVENVTVVKTITPDRNADFGGGLVEVNTLDIPTENFLNLSIGASYNDKTVGKDFLALSLSNREYTAQAGKHRFLLGTLDWKDRDDIVASYNKQGKNPSLFSNNWGVAKFKAPISPNYQASFGRVIRTGAGQQWGIVASASYRNTLATQDVILGREGFEEAADSEESKRRQFKGQRYGFTTNLGGMIGIGYRNEKNRIGFQSMYLRTLDQQFILGTGQNGKFGSDNTLGYFDLAMQTTLWQNQLKGEHAIGNKGVKIKWVGSYLKLDRQKPDNHMMLADYKQADGAGINDYNISTFGSNFAEGALRWWSRALENNYNWDAAVSVPFKFNAGNVAFENTFKGGYAGWNKDRLFFVLNTASKIDNKETNYLPLGQVFTPANNVQVDIIRFGDNFKKRSASLHALYAMLDNKIGNKFRLVWGLRAEYYNLNRVNDNLDSLFQGLTKGRPGFDYSDLTNREPNWRFFPSANLTYSLTPSMNIRAAYSQSIIRPDLRELSVFKEYDFELGGDYTSQIVRSTTIKHIDLRYEWYPGPGEILSASLFYKHLDYPMEIYRINTLNSYELKNSKMAKNYGVELEARKTLAFTNIPVIRNLTLYGNFTYLDSRVKRMDITTGFLDPNQPNKILLREVVGKEEKRPQMGASNYMVNAGIFYDNNPVSVSVSYNSVTNRVFVPNTDYEFSLMERPLQALDAQVAVRLLKQKAEIKLNVSNLLNSYSVLYRNQYTAEELQSFKDGGAPSAAQLKYNPKTDLLNFKASPGRTTSVTFSYRF
ncbi:TonB-dependent receptor [Chitinophaga pendula]|nr:TonB-dependent receptor [Chitinophaga pendula]